MSKGIKSKILGFQRIGAYRTLGCRLHMGSCESAKVTCTALSGIRSLLNLLICFNERGTKMLFEWGRNLRGFPYSLQDLKGFIKISFLRLPYFELGIRLFFAWRDTMNFWTGILLFLVFGAAIFDNTTPKRRHAAWEAIGGHPPNSSCIFLPLPERSLKEDTRHLYRWSSNSPVVGQCSFDFVGNKKRYEIQVGQECSILR